jgi:hypothetical protein
MKEGLPPLATARWLKISGKIFCLKSNTYTFLVAFSVCFVSMSSAKKFVFIFSLFAS